MRLQSNVAVYLLLKRGDETLLSLRQNTGYRDGNWSVVAGHVEEGEGVIDAIIREAKEEADIDIERDDLKVVHVMYYYDDRPYVIFFIDCEKYSGEIRNAEPHKCGGLKFFKENDLPSNTVEALKIAVENIKNGVFFSEVSL
ncbi:MAG: NUDIX domain-containing protein [Holosporaceae bacterium]|jgi:8-oxo-dGTP pyrophosphatase MutT (NUDIX family)|nr:NUDIX domain-containing protein [Holosporaceae bacterium]